MAGFEVIIYGRFWVIAEALDANCTGFEIPFVLIELLTTGFSHGQG
jgi:hypothetical protein